MEPTVKMCTGNLATELILKFNAVAMELPKTLDLGIKFQSRTKQPQVRDAITPAAILRARHDPLHSKMAWA